MVLTPHSVGDVTQNDGLDYIVENGDYTEKLALGNCLQLPFSRLLNPSCSAYCCLVFLAVVICVALCLYVFKIITRVVVPHEEDAHHHI